MADEGLKFFSTIQRADGSTLNRETPDRLELLAWVRAHFHEGDELTITIEARGAAAMATARALAAGAIRKGTLE